MANFGKLLKDEIARIARRQARALTTKLGRQSAQYRHDIAVLKRVNLQLAKKVTVLEGVERKRGGVPAIEPTSDDTNGIRFQARGLKSHRAKTGLSAADYGKLVGVSGQTVYLWETGKTRPRRKQLAALAAVRGMGKRQAEQRLEMLNGKADKPETPAKRTKKKK